MAYHRRLNNPFKERKFTGRSYIDYCLLCECKFEKGDIYYKGSHLTDIICVKCYKDKFESG